MKKNEPRICVNCSNQTPDQAAARCPQCGWKLTKLTPTRLWACGWVVAAAGGFITGMMVFVIWATSHSEFTGTARDAAFEFWMFTLISVLGLFSVLAGIWLIRHRKMNKMILYGFFGLAGLLIITIMMSL